MILFFLSIASANLHALSLKFEKIYQTEDTLMMGSLKLLYAKDTSFSSYDSLLVEYDPSNTLINNIKLEFLNIDEFSKLFFQVIIEFEDKVRKSNTFQVKSKKSTYKLFVREQDIFVEDTTPLIDIYKFEIIDSFASLIIFIIKMLFAFILVVIFGYPFKVFNYILLCNLFLVPLLYLAFPIWLPENLKYYLIPEVLILILETIFVYFITKKALKLRQLLFLNTFTNAVCYLSYNVLVATPYIL